MKESKMRTVIIGTGFAAAMHAKILSGLGIQITAVVNPDKDAAKVFATQYGAQHAETTVSTALSYGVDSVHVCTPPVSHVEILQECLEAGVHVFCEKPLSIDFKEAKKIFQLADEKKLIHALNFNNRFYENSEKAKKMITSPDFGAPFLIHGMYLQEFHALPDYYSWRYQPEVAGPMRAVTEIGSHWFDLARYWTGLEIEAVSATFGCFQPERIIKEGMMYPAQTDSQLQVLSEDAASITLRFSNGALGSVLISEISHGRGNRLSMEVSSAANSIWWNSETPYQLNQAQKYTGITTFTAPFGGGFLGTFQDNISAFYDAVENGQSPPHPRYATFKDGAINAAVCDALYHSATHESKWTTVHSV